MKPNIHTNTLEMLGFLQWETLRERGSTQPTRKDLATHESNGRVTKICRLGRAIAKPNSHTQQPHKHPRNVGFHSSTQPTEKDLSYVIKRSSEKIFLTRPFWDI
jgi:hypothetical protein